MIFITTCRIAATDMQAGLVVWRGKTALLVFLLLNT